MSARATLDIPAEVAAVLASGTMIDGCRVRITQQLDRALYAEVDKILRALGGKWNRSARAHVFESDPTERLRGGLERGEVDRLVVQYQFYETPRDLACEMAARAGVHAGDRVLEPSSGRGRLIAPCLALGATRIIAVELWEANLKHLHALLDAERVVHADFLTQRAVGPLYDVILMNPPFAHYQGVRHIRHAFDKWLVPGGRFVALCDAGAFVNRSAQPREFQAWLRERRVEVIDLPDGSFESSGTRVAAKMIVARKAGQV